MIFDCIIFFNELDLLELRLYELDSVVDRFVIVEAPVTFSGEPKPLHFADNEQRFAPWREKIIHIVVEDMPQCADTWQRESHQRNAVIRGLHSAASGDAVILSDADEIPSADAISRWSPELEPRRFEQVCSYYWINCVGGGWAGSRILPFSGLARYPSLDAIRYDPFPLLENGGWHFSFLGGAERVIAKLEAYSHSELNLDRYKDPKYLAIVMNLGIDIFGRSDTHWKFHPLDHRLPQALHDHPERFGHLVREVMFHEDWYPDDQILRLVAAYEPVRELDGAVVEFGCWEGKSTIAIAHACHPDSVIAVDTWAGNQSEDADHATVHLARERDVLAQFKRNIELLTPGNVIATPSNLTDFADSWSGPIRFAHIDASHEYRSVHRAIQFCLDWLVPGGVLCGDDFLSADMSRIDLDGGVERAVRELLPGFQQIHNFWSWQKIA
jgi:beta-1,4-mannosyl-glycoprotein beta-1,4-N-acetylglucosaminyltransferase